MARGGNAFTDSHTFRGWLCVAGGTLLHLSLGTLYTWGSLNPYIISYMRVHDSTATYSFASYLFTAALVGQASSVVLGGMIERRFGPRVTVYIGGVVFVTGIFLSYFTCKNFVLFCLTYGVMFGVGIGIAYASPMVCAMRWMPENRGIANGCVVAGFGAGAFIFNFVQTAFVNPNNLKPTLLGTDGKKYFNPEDVENVPVLFLILGATYSVMIFIGGLPLKNPPTQYSILTDVTGEDAEDPPLDVKPTHTQQYGPSAVIRTPQFWMMSATFMCNGQVVTFVANYFKIFGQEFIDNDRSLTIIASCSAACNALGRIMWGRFADRFGVKNALLAFCAIQTCFVFTFYYSKPFGGLPMYAIWVCVLFFNIGGNFSVMPSATAYIFGTEKVGVNYGLLFASQIPSAIIGAFATQIMLDALGYQWCFNMMGALTFIGLVNAAFLKTKVTSYFPCCGVHPDNVY